MICRLDQGRLFRRMQFSKEYIAIPKIDRPMI